MGEARRNSQQQQSAWPRSDSFQGVIDLHALPPVEVINGARIRALTGDATIGTEAAPAVLAYLFHRIGHRLDGSPTLIINEGWLALDDEGFAGQLREWLKTLRKKNASAILTIAVAPPRDAEKLRANPLGIYVNAIKWSKELDRRLSAALEDVPRGDGDLAEVTSLKGAVRAWLELDSEHKAAAMLTAERPVRIDGVSATSFSGEGISVLAERLPAPQEPA